MPIQFFIRLTN